MRHKKLKLSAVLLLGLGLSGLQAQTGIPASGGNASGSGGSVSYSAGQVVYTTNTGGANGTVAQGVQQPFEISVVTKIEGAVGISLQCSVSPNPTSELVELIVDSHKVEKLSYQLYDMNGKLLENNKIAGNSASIVMSNFAPATYFLKVSEGHKEIKSFKIIKN